MNSNFLFSFAGSLIPLDTTRMIYASSGAYDIGESTKFWSTIYADRIMTTTFATITSIMSISLSGVLSANTVTAIVLPTSTSKIVVAHSAVTATGSWVKIPNSIMIQFGHTSISVNFPSITLYKTMTTALCAIVSRNTAVAPTSTQQLCGRVTVTTETLSWQSSAANGSYDWIVIGI